MGSVIQTNVASLSAQKSLFKTNNELSTTFARLSSGFRINSAKDDASGLVISNQLSKEIGGSQVALRNANDGISFAQVAEGALQEVTNILLRMRDLSLSATSGQTPAAGVAALNAEYAALTAEITRIGADTAFGGTTVFGGSAAVVVDSNGSSTVTVAPAAIAAVGGSASNGGLAAVDAALTAIDTSRGALGAAQNRLTSAANTLNARIENASAARSRIRDTDYAVESANLAKNQVLQQAGFSVLSQANASSQSVLSLLQ